MKYFLKRGKWCIRDGNNTYKFSTEEEAQSFIDKQDPTPYVKSETQVAYKIDEEAKEVLEALSNNNTEEL